MLSVPRNDQRIACTKRVFLSVLRVVFFPIPSGRCPCLASIGWFLVFQSLQWSVRNLSHRHHQTSPTLLSIGHLTAGHRHVLSTLQPPSLFALFLRGRRSVIVCGCVGLDVSRFVNGGGRRNIWVGCVPNHSGLV
jgi:hypothetical protein